MPLEDALHGCQSHARSFKLVLPVQALEDTEKFVCVMHVEAYAIIAHPIDHFPILLLPIDFNLCVFSCA